MRAACRRSNTAERAGSAGGPKPGRAGFYLELGRVRDALLRYDINTFGVVEGYWRVYHFW